MEINVGILRDLIFLFLDLKNIVNIVLIWVKDVLNVIVKIGLCLRIVKLLIVIGIRF